MALVDNAAGAEGGVVIGGKGIIPIGVQEEETPLLGRFLGGFLSFLPYSGMAAGWARGRGRPPALLAPFAFTGGRRVFIFRLDHEEPFDELPALS